jgi:hypothetical protein
MTIVGYYEYSVFLIEPLGKSATKLRMGGGHYTVFKS